jgi:hypothetical protein
VARRRARRNWPGCHCSQAQAGADADVYPDAEPRSDAHGGANHRAHGRADPCAHGDGHADPCPYGGTDVGTSFCARAER